MTGKIYALRHGTITRLSAASGVSNPHLSLFFAGRRFIGRRAAVKLAEATGVAAEVWMAGDAQRVLGALAEAGWPGVVIKEGDG